jgi:hypothetical protein
MLPITDEEFADVVSQVGLAVWQIQVLEQVLGCHLVLVRKMNVTSARSKIEAMFVKADNQTLSELFGAIRDTNWSSSTLLPQLEWFREERNWLVHYSRHQNPADLPSAAKRAALIHRINTIAQEALSLAKAFQQATEEQLIAAGMPKAEIDARAAKIFNDWTSST